MSKQKVILFVEDESALQKVFKEALTKEGYEVVSALDGEEGLELAKNQKPDLILLDLILPRRDGFSVLEELKANSETTAIPVIVLTNLESSADVERAISMGAHTYLVKANYKLDEVITKIKDLFESV
jgi:DNA-binding response OmpR family regulator